jgi:diguanylate cyclase (GGDEF)-like protein/PAS domain S-box-containing protein
MAEFLSTSSYEFSWFAVPVLVAGGANWLLGLATFRRERGSPPSVTLLLMTLVIGVWLVGLGMANSTPDADVGTAWVKFSLVGTMFVPLCAFMHAALGTSRLHAMRMIAVAGAAISGTLAGLVMSTDLVLDHAHRYFWGFYPVYGAAGPLLIAYYGVAFISGGMLYRIGRDSTRSPTERKRMRIRLAALLVSMPATVDFLPALHVGVYPFGYAFVMGYIALSTYSLWRYRLVDITPALAAKQVIDTMNEGLIVVDRDGIIRVANGAASRMWGAGKHIVGEAFRGLSVRWEADAQSRLVDAAGDGELEVAFAGADGAPRTAMVVTSRLLDHLGEWVGTVYLIHDITERWQAEAAVRQSEERFRSLVQNASDLITVIDPDTTVRYQSPAVTRVLGYDADFAIGNRLIDAVHKDDAGRFLAALDDLIARPGSAVTGEGRVRHADGTWRYLEFTGTDQRENPAIGGLVLNVRDVTERKRLEDQLRYQALHDPLTQLANRTRFAESLEHALARRRTSGESVAVLFMDLDNFKGINDSLGHSAGDALLRQVAARIRESVRPGDTIARLGGDEFAVLVEGVSAVDDAIGVTQRIFDALEAPFRLDGREITTRLSIGIAASGDGYDAEKLLRDADIAMYVAKSQGKACYRLFDASFLRPAAEAA